MRPMVAVPATCRGMPTLLKEDHAQAASPRARRAPHSQRTDDHIRAAAGSLTMGRNDTRRIARENARRSVSASGPCPRSGPSFEDQPRGFTGGVRIDDGVFVFIVRSIYLRT